jgi:hypothetical protein
MSKSYQQKYIKYKNKYLEFKNQSGGIFPIKNDTSGTPKIFYYSASNGRNLLIEEKIRVIYTNIGWSGSAQISNTESEFFYIENENDDIIAIVKISNNIPRFQYELGFDFILEDYRKKGLYELLLNHRIIYIQINYPTQMYVCYTEHDKLKHYHSDCGMTLCPSNKVPVDGTMYWRYEINRNFKELITNNTNEQNCTGMEIGRLGNCSYIYTARHCLYAMADLYPNIKINYRQIKEYNLPKMISFEVKDKLDTDSTNNDMAIIQTDIMHDISNIYVLINSDQLPNDYNLKWFGNTTNRWLDEKIDELNLQNDIKFTSNSEGTTTIDNYKKWFRFTTGQIRGGDSGGPHGIWFDKNNTKFAIVGITLQGHSNPRNPIRIIDTNFLDTHRILYNKARYNPTTKQIDIIEQNIGQPVPPVPLLPLVPPIPPIPPVPLLPLLPPIPPVPLLPLLPLLPLTKEEISKLINFLEQIMKIYHKNN